MAAGRAAGLPDVAAGAPCPAPLPPACIVGQLHPYMVDEEERMELGVTGLGPLLPLSPPLGIDAV